MGDINANVGGENSGYETTMGRHALGTRNENGQMFMDFCADNDLVIGGSVFPHRDVHKKNLVPST